MIRISSLILLLLVAVTATATNSLSLTSTSGHPGDEVTITANLTADDAVAAVDITIPLTKYTSYVAESAKLVDGRANGHQISAAYTNGALRILVYNISLEPLTGNGDLLTFKLKMGKEPADYALTPAVKLSDSDGTSLDVETSGSTVTLLSPKLQVENSAIDFGRSAIKGTYTKTLTLTNTGNEPLNITSFKSSATELTVSPATATIEAGSSSNFDVIYSPVNRATGIEERIIIESDAVNGTQNVTVTAIPYSVNELHTSGASGSVDEEITISLTMNNMEPIVSAQSSFELPNELKYVEGSVTGGSRLNGHTVNATCSNGVLTLFVISMTNTPINGNEGELLNFKLKIDGSSGYYRLTPKNVVLSNAASENMVSDVYGSTVEINSPRISCNDTLDLGEGSVTDGVSATFNIENNGWGNMEISRIVFADEGYSVAETLPLSIASYRSSTITVKYNGDKAGAFSTTMNIYSNDPDNRMKSVAVSGSLYEPNKLEFSGDPSDDYNSFTLHVDLTNYSEIVGLQFDVHGLTGMTATANDLVLSSRAASHSATIREIEPGVHRVVVYSMNNNAFTDNSGRVLDITFSGASCRDGQFNINNIKLSNAAGENYTSPDASVAVGGNVNVIATSITLDQTTASVVVDKTLQLAATVNPSNVANKAVTWSSSDESVATVDANGMVTAHKVGTATITVATTDGSNLTATCALTVTPQVVTALTISNETASIVVDKTLQLTATIAPENATTKAVTWSSSDDSVATVDANGLVTAHKVGTATITVATTDGSNLTATCALTVTPQLVESIELSQTQLVLNIGDEYTLEAVILPDNATDKSVVWTTSDSAIVSVNDGVITALAAGTATITVTAADDSNVCATCEVEVTKNSGITDIFSDMQTGYNIYMLNGVLVKSAATAADVKNLTTGFYIINGKKIFIK
jgi:uncharacterized protein YjdB